MQPTATDLAMGLFRRVDDLWEEVAALRQEVQELRASASRRPDDPPQRIRMVEFLAKHQEVTEGQLRAWIFQRETNGLAKSGALSKPGKCWLIDERRFLRWREARGC